MKLKELRRERVRHWDTVHKSWDAVLDHDYMWPMRHRKPCRTYTPWCGNCIEFKFIRDHARFPFSIAELNDYENKEQGYGN